MEKRILESLENTGWHLKPSVVSNVIADIDEEEEDSAARMSERDFERKVRAEILDSDLSAIGARFLPDAQSLLNLRTLQTPCVLQVAAIKDASQSNQGAGSTSGRLLHLRLTDGHRFLTAIEYRSVPSLSVDVPPGTKVTLLGSVSVYSGIVLLEPNAIRIEGGHVAALHEAWVMQRKYAGALSRLTTDGATGPPPFRGLNSTTKAAQAPKPSVPSGVPSSIKPNKPPQDAREHGGASTNVDSTKVKAPVRPAAERYRLRGRQENEKTPQPQLNAPHGVSGVSEATTLAEAAPQKHPVEHTRPLTAPAGSSSQSSAPEPKAEARVREKAPDVVPMQNRQAAQKLLDRRTDAGFGSERGRGRGGRGFRRGRGRDDFDEYDERVMTLDEYEAKRTTATAAPSAAAAVTDQELARRLQEQFNLEDSALDMQPKQMSAAEQLRQSMFSFVPEPSSSSVDSSRGRGRGRGHGRGRGRR